MSKKDTEYAADLAVDVGSTDAPLAVDVGPVAPEYTYLVIARAKHTGTALVSIQADSVTDAFGKLGKLRDNKLDGYDSAKLRQEGASELCIIDTSDGVAWYTEPFTYIV